MRLPTGEFLGSGLRSLLAQLRLPNSCLQLPDGSDSHFPFTHSAFYSINTHAVSPLCGTLCWPLLNCILIFLTQARMTPCITTQHSVSKTVDFCAHMSLWSYKRRLDEVWSQPCHSLARRKGTPFTSVAAAAISSVSACQAHPPDP